MNHTRNAPVLWDRVALLIIILLIGASVIWWLESRFGAGIAILILGGLAGVALYTIGNFAGRRDTITTVRETMTAMSDHTHEVSKALELRARAQGQIATKENAYIIQQERDAARYVNRLAQQQARLLAAPDEPDEPPIWERQQQPHHQSPQGFTVYE